MSKKSRDYLRNKPAAMGMAERIEEYWHRKGYPWVKVWVETSQRETDYGTKLPAEYSIRSNMKYNVANIKDGMIE